MVQARLQSAFRLGRPTGKAKAAGDSDKPTLANCVARRIFVRCDVPNLLVPHRLIGTRRRLCQIFRRENDPVGNFVDQVGDGRFPVAFPDGYEHL